MNIVSKQLHWWYLHTYTAHALGPLYIIETLPQHSYHFSRVQVGGCPLQTRPERHVRCEEPFKVSEESQEYELVKPTRISPPGEEVR